MSRRVLIIDDEVDLCTMVSSFLRKRNYNVDCAHSLADGIHKIDEVHPDVLLLDNNLPDGLGWDAAATIHERYPEMRITLVSANDALSNAGGANDTFFTKLLKPISLASIESYL